MSRSSLFRDLGVIFALNELKSCLSEWTQAGEESGEVETAAGKGPLSSYEADAGSGTQEDGAAHQGHISAS